MKEPKSVSHFYLFRTFLHIGATSFGGYTALISFVEKKLVSADKLVKEEDIMDSMTVASLLPGPLAVNVVANLGYKLKGWTGAMLSMTAVLLPSVILMIVAAEFFIHFGEFAAIKSLIAGVVLLICGLVSAMVYRMGKKNIQVWWQVILAMVSFGLMFAVQGYTIVVTLIVLGAVVGVLFSKGQNDKTSTYSPNPITYKAPLIGLIVFSLITFFWPVPIFQSLVLTFAKVSLTLFGGGYVMIPILHDLVVTEQDWITSEAFSTAISLGQMTPGPILVSATYVGYLVYGLVGAIASTIAIFLPSAMLMILLSSRLEVVSSSPRVKGAMRGIRPVIVGIMAFSVVVLFMSADFSWLRLIMAVIAALLLIFTKINDFLLILLFGVVGVIFL